ncbi:hypothetical protein C3F09_11805 [candidate division GN15 bacterium]|uniref:Ubiquinone biosynthesis protein UbiA n=1 Tax=candidate division GN15 bacterium TaxID=2072418 RepID=A0A855WUY4_9BACT|nr:MAG: hypothetical protein C3F09_11805 [candidate division GN15 bacterium]
MAGWLKAVDLFFAARPMLHLPIWSIYLVCLHYHHQLDGGRFDRWNLLMLLCLSFLAAGSYWWNQSFDAESDFENRKLGFLQRGFLNRAQLSSAFLISSLVGLAIAPIYSALVLAIFAQAFVLSFTYSAPPFRLKDRPFWGLFANAWGIGFLVPFCVMPELTIHNAGLLGWDNPIYFFFAVASIYIITTIPDAAGDRLAGKRTIAVLFGKRAALVLALILVLLSAVIAYWSGYVLLCGISLASALTIVTAIVFRSVRVTLAAAKTPILLLTILAGYFYPVYFVFIIVLVTLTRLYYARRFHMTYPRLA